MSEHRDTIAAIATAPGRGGVGIVRVSGPQARSMGEQLTRLSECRPRYAHYGPFYDSEGQVLDRGISLYFPGPHSYTGEDVFEFQGHGGPVVLNLLLKSVFKLGARPAQPGEFTERAFLNDKMDLAQAEAVADLIESTTEQAALAATRSLSGAFSSRIQTLLDSLIYIRLYIEAALDFPEEEIDFLGDSELAQRMQQLRLDVASVKQSVRQGKLLREGMSVVLLGQPNAGKSSLLNALAGDDTAIVTDVAGTTRDVLQQAIHLDGLPLNIIDTAGLRDTQDVVEAEGVRRAWAAVEQADRVLLLIDAERGFDHGDQAIVDALDRHSTNFDYLWNKIDRLGQAPKIEKKSGQWHLSISASLGEGIDLLSKHLKEAMGYKQETEGLFIARQRHIESLEAASKAIECAADQLSVGAGELAAEELRQAQESMSQITGEFSSDDLLGEIFSRFCIGK